MYRTAKVSIQSILYKYGPVMRVIWSFMDLRQQGQAEVNIVAKDP